MKMTKAFVAAVAALALTSAAFATPPSDSANPSNSKISEKLARDYMKAVAKDTRQDERGQAKLDRIWASFIKQGLIPAGTPNPLVYEGSARDMAQDDKLNDKLEREFRKAGVPFTSPIS